MLRLSLWLGLRLRLRRRARENVDHRLHRDCDLAEGDIKLGELGIGVESGLLMRSVAQFEAAEVAVGVKDTVRRAAK